ncbi:pantetheine-phosphate adenylyltransferase [Xylanimonas protaetiae]|uniref:Phosphopantetheine adenylyltransferase n=1 Tax=Xylanimonas protaetiae TaxID=2509457 RepID=A0A4P6F6F3_9MICO|nr:pantetheine-phosphate adenylyltransferase [Xylanimonas protaetiae]QAY71560.1 pantetheine-phosphate adenylyltransferase [Xylanimonas protaetiae]
MTIAVCPGSFDPFTLGHLDVVRRARTLFDGVVVGVAKNAGKTGLLTLDERVEIVRAALAADPATADVRAEVVPGLVVDFCREVGATAMVKGLRGGGDLDAELPMALANRHLTGVETVYLPADPAYAHVASSLVKDIARHGGAIEDMVPDGVAAVVRAALAAQQR